MAQIRVFGKYLCWSRFESSVHLILHIMIDNNNQVRLFTDDLFCALTGSLNMLRLVQFFLSMSHFQSFSSLVNPIIVIFFSHSPLS